MAKFSQQFLQAMAQPSYQQGLFSAARSLGELPGRLAEEREVMGTQQTLAEMMNTNSRIAETGNLKGLEEQRTKLMGMLSGATSDQSRDMILGELGRVENLRDVAKPVARQRDINTLVSAETSIAEANAQIEELKKDITPQGQIKLSAAIKAKAAIQKRIDSLKSDPALVAEKNQYEYNLKLKNLTQKNQMFNQEKLVKARELMALEYGSPDYNDKVANLNSNGFGSVVKEFEKNENERQTALLTLNKLKEETRPLNATELSHAKELNLPIEDVAPMLQRSIYMNALTEISKLGYAASRTVQSLTAMSDAEAESTVELALEEMKSQGEQFLPMFETMDEYIEDMPAEEKQILYGMVKGKTKEQVPGIIEDYFSIYAPEAFDRMKSKVLKEEKVAQEKAKEQKELMEKAKEVISNGFASNIDEAITWIENETNKRIASRAIQRGNIN